MKQVHQVQVSCSCCGAALEVPPWRARTRKRHFCDKRCYLKTHATTPLTCQACGKAFVAMSYSADAKYCCRACVPRTGTDNPNYGLRHPGMWQMPAERRLRMSDQRRGAGNPGWAGGSPGNGLFQHQSFVHAWALEQLPQRCLQCGSSDVELHHIAARRLFDPRRLAHFAENLTMLCRAHNIQAHWRAKQAMQARKPADLLFSDRLPQSILDALARDGSVSAVMAGCDYSPLGNLAESLRP